MKKNSLMVGRLSVIVPLLARDMTHKQTVAPGVPKSASVQARRRRSACSPRRPAAGR